MPDFAWSPIIHGDGVIEIGEEVSASEIGVDDDEYDLIKASGAIRERPYPKDVGPNESPRERNIRKLKEVVDQAQEDAYADMPILDEPTHLTGEVSTEEVQSNKDESTEERKDQFFR